jgi:hypothetical protein
MHPIFGATRKTPAHALCDSFGTGQDVEGIEVYPNGQLSG